MIYRADIDGLRAIAVVAVILYHADYALFSGGYVGVDVFFVISGFLITSILCKDLQSGEFSLVKFYQRRARRILPALFLVALLTSPAAWLWLPPEEMKNHAESLIALVFFASNFLFWIESGYFEIVSELKPLIHTWSLAVEEQYYLLYPLLLLSLWKLGNRTTLLALASLLGASLLYAEWAAVNQPSAAFYLLPARAWELLIGGLIALYSHSNGAPKFAPALADKMSLIGLLLIAFSVLVFDELTPVQGIALMLPVTGTLLIIIYGNHSKIVQHSLSNPALVHLGLISYSAYLWHQPLLAFARTYFLDEPAPVVTASIVLLTFPLAHLSWKYVEQPFRRPAHPDQRIRLRVLALPVLALLSLGWLGSSESLLQSRFAAVEQQMAAYFDPAVDAAEDQSNCFISRVVDETQLNSCLATTGAQYAILIGDSHAAAQSLALRNTLQSRGVGLISFVHEGCPPAPGLQDVSPDANPSCVAFIRDVYERVPNLQADFIVISAYWIHYLRRMYAAARVDPLNLQRSSNNFAEASDDDPTAYVQAVSILAEQLSLLGDNQNVVIVGPIPEANGGPNGRIRAMLMRGISEIEISSSHEEYRRLGSRFDALSGQLSGNIEIVLPETLVCSRRIPGRCENTREGKSLYRDFNHPAYSFAVLIAEEVIRQAVALDTRATATRFVPANLVMTLPSQVKKIPAIQ